MLDGEYVGRLLFHERPKPSSINSRRGPNSREQCSKMGIHMRQEEDQDNT